MKKTSENTESFEFQAEIQQLLSILVHSLYTERDIFLRELISNASDALNRVQFELLTNRDLVDPDVELAIRIAVDKESRMITISDTGIGIAEEEIGLIFEEFYRSKAGKAYTQMGTGLGLSIVKRIVETYEGSIGVQSQVGKGTCFTFTLPLEREQAHEQQSYPSSI